MRRKTQQEWKQELKGLVDHSYVFLEPYKNDRTKLAYYHADCGEIHYINPGSLKRGRRCPTCSRIKRNLKLTKSNAEWLDQVKELVGDEYTFLEPYKGNHKPIKYRHNVCGFVGKIDPANFLAGHRCVNCSNQYQSEETYKQKMFDMYHGAYTLVSHYNKSSKKVKIRHNKCHRSRWVNANNFIQGKSHCIFCSQSNGEQLVMDVLKDYGVDYNYGYVLPNKLHLDFYIPKKKLGIEYDGIQHYEPRDIFGGEMEFKKQRERDKRKDKYCIDHEITLIRIPYTVNTFSQAKNILRNYI